MRKLRNELVENLMNQIRIPALKEKALKAEKTMTVRNHYYYVKNILKIQETLERNEVRNYKYHNKELIIQ